MECLIDKNLKKINRKKSTKLSIIRRYLKMKIKIDIEPNALNRRIQRLELYALLDENLKVN